MVTAYPIELLAEQHRAELRREAADARLAAMVRCCTPSAWARGARRAVEAVSRLRAARRDQSLVTCCA